MKKKVLGWIAGVLCSLLMTFFMTSVSYSQLRLTATYPSVQSLLPPDIDFRNEQSDRWLFTLRIDNLSGRDTTAKLAGNFQISLADGRRFFDAVLFTTRPFIIPPGGRTITNLDIDHAPDIRLECYNYSSEAENTIREIALSTGQIPAGTYTINLRMVDAACQVRSDCLTLSCTQVSNIPASVIYQIASFSNIELRSPQNGQVLQETLPFFEWLFSSSGVASVTLRVARLQPGESGEEALSRTPLQYEVDLRNQSSHQVGTGGRPWDPGEYAWTVIGHRAGGDDVHGQIWKFSIASPLSNAATGGNVLNQVNPILSGDIINYLSNSNLTPTGKFYLNGQLISQAELQRIITELIRNKDRIEHTWVE